MSGSISMDVDRQDDLGLAADVGQGEFGQNQRFVLTPVDGDIKILHIVTDLLQGTVESCTKTVKS